MLYQPHKRKISVLALLSAIIFVIFYIEQYPFGFQSNDSLLGFGDVLRILVELATIIVCISFILASPPKILKTKMYSIFIYGILFLLFYQTLSFLVEPKSLRRHQNLAFAFYKQTNISNGSSPLDGLKKFCAPQTIDTLVFPPDGLNGSGATEVEFQCGDKSGVYSFVDGSVIGFSDCKYGRYYNLFMRQLGLLKRKNCWK